MFDVKINEYLKLVSEGDNLYAVRLNNTDDIKYLITRKSYSSDTSLYYINKPQFEICITLKKLKNGKYIYIFNDEFYSTEDEVIEEMKRMGIK
jgi:hypothetical protein